MARLVSAAFSSLVAADEGEIVGRGCGLPWLKAGEQKLRAIDNAEQMIRMETPNYFR